MKGIFKSVLCITLALLLCIGLCACGEGSSNNGGSESDTSGFAGDLPEAIFGTWYPHPEVSDVPIEISSDGACTIDGQPLQWDVESTNEDEVVLTANGGAYYFTFTQLRSDLPLLTTNSLGMAIKEPELWKYMTEWYNEQTGSAFTFDFEALTQANCNIRIDNGSMTIEVLDGESITHTIMFVDSEATVTDKVGNSTVYFPIDGGSSGGDLEDPEGQYMQAMNNLQRVLATGDSTTYVDSNGEYEISDSEALERLYNTFVSLQNYMDVSEQLNCIREVKNMPISLVRSDNGVSSSFKEYTYNSFGTMTFGWDMEDAISSGTQIYNYHDGSGNVYAIEIWGLIKGEPVYGADGKLSGVIVTSNTTREKYTASVTCDSNGDVIRIDVPFVENAVDGIIQGATQTYEFLYDHNGRLNQFSNTQYSTNGTYDNTHFYKEQGFYSKTITECYYDTTGRLMNTIEHEISIGTHGVYFWSYTPTQYIYNAEGLLGTRIVSVGHIDPAGLSREDMEKVDGILYALFHAQGFVDSVSNKFLEQIDCALSDVHEIARFEYEYGSIYVYQTEE